MQELVNLAKCTVTMMRVLLQFKQALLHSIATMGIEPIAMYR